MSTNVSTTPTEAASAVGFPVSFAQQRLWFLYRLQPDSSAYNIPLVVRLTGTLDVPAMEQAVLEVQRRHETLRTTFTTIDERPMQVISPTPATTLAIVDLSGTPAEGREQEARRLAGIEAHRPFDLENGPVFRAVLVRLSVADHVLMLIMHHITADGWSLGILTREVSTLYDAFRAGKPSPLPELAIQYADFAVWQRDWLQGEELDAQLSYWRKKLEGLSTLALAADRPRPTMATSRGEIHHIVLPEPLPRSIKDLCRASGSSPFMVLLAGFAAVLHRYTGQSDIVLGSPIANRNRSEIEPLIGLFTNSLVIRTDCAGDPTFGELLQRVRETTLDAFGHQDLPFERLVEALQPARDPSRNPLFQVSFAVQNTPSGPLRLGGLTVAPFAFDVSITHFDLEVLVWENEDSLSVIFCYNADLFDASTIQRLAEHYQTLLAAAMRDANQHISGLPLLTEAERQQVVVDWNRTECSYPADWCFQQLFESQVDRTPDAVAVTFGNDRLTYRELNSRANRLARHLQSLGARAETLVGVCTERSPEMVVALLAIAKAGAAYVPLDPGHPKTRLEHVITDTKMPLILCQDRLVGRLPEDHGARIVRLDADWDRIITQPDGNLPVTTTPDNLVYVLYTSGSTGKPKGALITHRGLVNYLSWGASTYAVAEGEGAPVHSPLVFDLTITGLFMPLIVGKTVDLLPEDAGVEALGDQLRQRSNYSLVKITPAHLDLVRQQLSVDTLATRTRAFIIGGEQLTWESIAPWVRHAPETVLVNEYGPTETVVGCCVYRVPPGASGTGAVPIGRPIANTQLYVLDQYRQLAPIGAVGELYIGGVGVARGYLNRPELSAERFIDDPFTGKPGARLYRTGDLARYRTDGNLEFLGRIDDQVKVRGHRIELGEVEAALSAHASVAAVAVIVREVRPGDRRLVAYLAPTPAAGAMSAESQARPVDAATNGNGGSPAGHGNGLPESVLVELTASVRAFVRERLPEYMVPSALVWLANLPLTSNGKVDRHALPSPEGHLTATQHFVAPRTPTEQDIAAMWQDVLGAERVGVLDNFFELGGHSLLATQVVSRIRDAFQVELPLRTLFQEPTVEAVALAVVQAQAVRLDAGELSELLAELEAPKR